MIRKKYILGIDVGGTSIKYGLVSKQGKLIKFHEVPTPKTKSAILKTLSDIIELQQEQVSKIGLGLPGKLDLKQGKIIHTPNIKLSGVAIVKLLQKKFSLPTKIDNDANCFTLAEAIAGSGKIYNHVAGLTLGTGIGGGIVINKKIYRGSGHAGRLGHLIIDCKNGKDLEGFLGAKKLKLKPLNYYKLEKDAKLKKPRAVNFFNHYGEVLGFGLINIIRTLDPEIIILGGKQSRSYSLFKPQMNKVINQYCSGRTKIVKSKLIDQAGIIGAAMLFTRN